MRFHSTELPKLYDTVIVSITGTEGDKIIYVKLLEYDGIMGNIMMSTISQKKKLINKFLKVNKSHPFPCSVTNTDSNIPILVPVNAKSNNEITHHMNRYYCLEKLEKLVDDFVFQNTDIDSSIFYEKFLWEIADKFNSMENIPDNQFDKFMKDIPSMFSLGELDKNIIDTLTTQLTQRITCSEVSMYGTIDICVMSAHGQVGLSRLIDKLIELVSQCYYRNAPTYGFIVKSSNEKTCIKNINSIKSTLDEYAASLGLNATIDYTDQPPVIRDCVVKLTPLNKTHVSD